VDLVADIWDHLRLFGWLKHLRPSPCPWLLAGHYSPPELCTWVMIREVRTLRSASHTIT
jgi:hypothetical protein